MRQVKGGGREEWKKRSEIQKGITPKIKRIRFSRPKRSPSRRWPLTGFAGSIEKMQDPEHHARERETGYRLAFGTQVREEDFGLLFYTMRGPRLYFLSSENLLSCRFFGSGIGLEEWLARNAGEKVFSNRLQTLEAALGALKEKGVIVEC
jgi:putative mycofactocin binding protein MftB